MITNSEVIEKKYKCGKSIMKYLVYTCNLPILSTDRKYYYFAYTDKLQEAIKNMPIFLKFLSVLSR